MLDPFPGVADRGELFQARNGLAPGGGRGSGESHAEQERSVLARGHSAVRAMKRRRLEDGEPWQKHELFPAPPWATRTLFEEVLPFVLERGIEREALIAEPAAGLGHMSDVIAEYADRVFAADIFSYPCAVSVPKIVIADFLEPSWPGPQADWIITNPPFALSAAFLDRALERARHGVAFLQRMQWLEGQRRYRAIYARHPPSLLAPFSERVGMCEGGFDPDCGTATMYAWFVWVRQDGGWPAPLAGAATLKAYLIPPGRREAYAKASDLGLAARCVPGFVPPSQRGKKDKGHRALRAASGEAAATTGGEP